MEFTTITNKNGQNVRVAQMLLPDTLEITGARKRKVQKNSGEFIDLYEATTSLGTVTISKVLYDALMSGRDADLPADDKVYFQLKYIGISGTGENAFISF